MSIYDAVKQRGGEGVMLRTPDGLYQAGVRSKDIVKWKVWKDCSARVVDCHQLACPVQYADEVKIVDGKERGFKNSCGSVTVEILPDQPLPAGAVQNCMFTGNQSLELRRKFWVERDSMVGKVVDFEYLKGGNVGRMARIYRVREDLL
jgi:hypothetical protein